MRMSTLFFRSLRETPADAEVASHQLMLRAGLIQQVAAGIFDYLPLGLRVKRKVEAILREEMDAIDGQEVSLPVVQPAELWERSGRWGQIGSEMARFKDAGGRDMCLGMTHEEAVTDLASRVARSYKQLPFMLYQIQTKFRDEARPRAGLIRVREFTMKDAYSFHVDEADLDAYYPKVHQAYFDTFRRAGLDAIAVESDTGMMGGSMAHEFMALSPIGEDTLLICEDCGYRANRQVATRSAPEIGTEVPLDLEDVSTPDTKTIADLAAFLGLPESRTAKAVFMVGRFDPDESQDASEGSKGRPAGRGDRVEVSQASSSESSRSERMVFCVLRGDDDLNETKLANAVGALELRPAREEEIRAIGAVAGYASPVGVDRDGVLVIADTLVERSTNLVAGANREGYHLLNVNYGRDWTADQVVDIAAVAEGDGCPRCRARLIARRGIEVGNIFKLGTKYSSSMGASFLDPDGKPHPMVMGCYGIGVGRLIASVIEADHDDAGIVWPISIAPYELHLISLAHKPDSDVAAAANEVYFALSEAGIETLFDDRPMRAGVKFNDADLLGMPLRLTVGARGLERGVVEYKLRRDGSTGELSLDDLASSVQDLLQREHLRIRETLRPEPLQS